MGQDSTSQSTHLVYSSQARRALNQGRKLVNVTERLIYLRILHSSAKTNKRTRRSKRGGKRKRPITHSIPVVVCNRLSRRDTHETKKCLPKNLIYINKKSCVEHATKLRVACLNTQSARNKGCKINCLVSDENIDILCITESWIKPKGDDAIIKEMCPLTHFIEHFPRQNRLGCGIAFIYNKNLTGVKMSKLDLKSCEASMFSFNVDSVFFNICCVYRLKVKLSLFYEDFRHIILRLKLSDSPFVITGDFNIHYDVDNTSMLHA